jgi:hypothetical protein
MCSLISTVLIHVQLRCVQCSNNTKHNILCTEESIIGVVSEKRYEHQNYYVIS